MTWEVMAVAPADRRKVEEDSRCCCLHIPFSRSQHHVEAALVTVQPLVPWPPWEELSSLLLPAQLAGLPVSRAALRSAGVHGWGVARGVRAVLLYCQAAPRPPCEVRHIGRASLLNTHGLEAASSSFRTMMRLPKVTERFAV